MANVAQPTLRKHATGVYFTRWGGRDHYFSKDAAASRREFTSPDSTHPGALARWMQHNDLRATARSRTARIKRLRIAEIYNLFDADLFAHRKHDERIYYRAHLKRFLLSFGAIHGDELDIDALLHFRADLAGMDLKPKTIAHDVRSVRTFIRWAGSSARRLVAPIILEEFKPPRVPKSLPEPLPREQIIDAIVKVRKTAPWLAPWIATGYLTGCRPTELIRISLGQGRLITIPPEDDHPAIPGGAYELVDHKTAARTQRSRFILLSEEALIHLRGVQPMPHRGRPLAQAARLSELHKKLCSLLASADVGGLLHRLRDSAATHLLDLGVDQGTVAQFLGHAPSGELPRYGRAGLRILRAKACRLTLR